MATLQIAAVLLPAALAQLPGCYEHCGNLPPGGAANCAVVDGCSGPNQACICNQLDDNKVLANVTATELLGFFPSCYDYCNSNGRCDPNNVKCFITCACAGVSPSLLLDMNCNVPCGLNLQRV